MQKVITCQHNDDSYETTYDTDTHHFGVVWRYSGNFPSRPTPHAFSELTRPVQERLENAVMKLLY